MYRALIQPDMMVDITTKLENGYSTKDYGFWVVSS
jgi:hypothetical protein